MVSPWIQYIRLISNIHDRAFYVKIEHFMGSILGQCLFSFECLFKATNTTSYNELLEIVCGQRRQEYDETRWPFYLL